MFDVLSFRLSLTTVLLLLAGLSMTSGHAATPAKGDGGFIFVGTNHNNSMDSTQPPNQVAMYRRAADGSLTLLGYFDTGGQGSGPSARFAGDGLGAAHSVQLSQDLQWLFVTNAGTNNVSVFRVRNDGLQLTDIEPTGGPTAFPNSVTQWGDLVYVLNSANEGSITGFRFDPNHGKLLAIPNSTRVLNANQTYPPDTLFNPAEVSFTPDGSHLVVTIKDASNLIQGVSPTGPGRVLVFGVRYDGTPSQSYRQTNLNNGNPNQGYGPFGFSFDLRGHLLIALFTGGTVPPGATAPTAAAGSYRIDGGNRLAGISPDVPDYQFDTCWLENNGTYAFTANYTSASISSFAIGMNGSLTLLNEAAGVPDPTSNVQGPTPLDIRVSPDGQFVYDVLPGSGHVAAWRINDDGSLSKIGEYYVLPPTVNGDHAPQERFGPGSSPAGIDVI
jgi:hypothetical protein